MEHNLTRIDDFFLRALFSSSWIAVIFQHLLLNQGGLHRFNVLSITNKIQATCYVLLLVLFFLLKGNIRIPSSKIILFFVTFSFLFIVGSIQNSLSSAVIDFILIAMQIIFFYLGWIFFERLGSKKIVKKILSDSILIAFILGIIFFRSGLEYSSPIIGFFALSVYAIMRFGSSFSIYFWIMLVLMNIFWAFGKQTLLISAIALVIIYFNPKSIRSILLNYRNASNNFIKLIFLSPILFFSGYFVIFSGIEFGSVRKLMLLVDNTNLVIPLQLLMNYPDLVFQIVDVSTAGRLYELIIVLNGNFQSVYHFLFGSGLGGEIALSAKNEFADIQFTFGTTRVVQTLPVFLLLKFGFMGTLLSFLWFIVYFLNRHHSQYLFFPFFLCLFASILAFTTIFKFHFLGFFWGAMAAQINKTRGRRTHD